ncbi:hypothetical protein, partial [Escherichia coli]|uniref:hypothetical protein n=1 Tax=Escherichia coli TaxID=562 RepID=UPI0032DB3941
NKGRILEHFGQVLEEKGITRKNTSWKRIGSCLLGQGPSTCWETILEIPKKMDEIENPQKKQIIPGI